MDVRIATFNIFGFPASFLGNERVPDDMVRIREVIRRLDADVLVFQEIVGLTALEEILSGLGPTRAYRMRDAEGRWLASGLGSTHGMKVPIAFDSARLELVEAGLARRTGDPAATSGRRDSIVARLRPLGGGPIFTVIGVHLKSGYLYEGPVPVGEDDLIRVDQMARLTEWITTLSPLTIGGPDRQAGEPAVLIGDFNALPGNAALLPLSQGGGLSSWSLVTPRFASSMSPAPVEVDLQGSDRWTTLRDRKIIDHVVVSPETRLTEAPWVYAFDRDSSWLETVGVSADWLHELGYSLMPNNGVPEIVKNIHRISDHRPVRATVALD